MNKLWARFKQLSLVKRGLVVFGTVVVLSAASHGQPVNTSNTGTITNDQGAATQQIKHSPVVTTKEVTETEAVPFTSTTVEDPSMTKGTSQITTAGVNGTKTLTYLVTYSDGVQTNKVLKTEAVTIQPINQITTVGTYVAPVTPSCPNGTYVNSAGNTVCSPYQSNSAPAGATAQCVDGTYSFSQTHSGTCSHHGGVATWL